jgi:biotin carboxylase
MTGSLLVLGAGEEQVALYREARRRGLHTIAVDMRADRPGIPLADEFLHLSTMDHEAIGEALDGRDLAGVVSTAADTCLETWHRIAKRFTTPWRLSATAARVSMDKSEFHRVAAATGIPTYRWCQSDRLDELAMIAAGFKLPVVVKPTDASGGRGVRIVDSRDDLDVALKYAAEHSPTRQVIAEEFLVGVDYTVNVFMLAGEVAFSVISEKQILPGQGFLIGGNIAPARLSAAVEDALLSDARRLCAAFDYPDGPANFDVIVSHDHTRYFLEVGARMSGNGFPQLAMATSGVDVVAACVDLAVGAPVRLPQHRRRPAWLQVLKSPVDTQAVLAAAVDTTEVEAMPGVEWVEVFPKAGDAVLPFTEAGRKLGWLVVSADDHDQLAPILEAATRALRITVTG